MPAEAPDSTCKDRVLITACAVYELGGLIFTYGEESKQEATINSTHILVWYGVPLARCGSKGNLTVCR